MLSVLIVNWNTRDLLRGCIRSILKYPPNEETEIIVVDNASKDGSAEMVQEEFPEVKLILPGKNTGYAHGNNLAFEAASGEWLLTLNPDTEMRPETLQAAIEKLKSHPECGALGIQQIGVDGKVQHSVRGFPTFAGIFGEITGLGKLWPNGKLGSYRQRNFDYSKEQIAEQPMGTFLLFRRQALETIGDAKQPFDEQFPIFFNEVDLLYRLRQAGWPCLYTPDAKIKHFGGESTKQVKKSMIWESHRSLNRFLRKHRRNFTAALFLPLFSGLNLLGAFVRARGYDAGFRV